MHIKTRRGRALLYRSAWVPRGAGGNSHGYTRQVYVGSIAADATVVPVELRERLDKGEVEFVENRICRLARECAERQLQEANRRERDPAWRVAEAVRLVAEAAERSAEQPVAAVTVAAVRDAVGQLRVTGNLQVAQPATTSDPLADALAAVEGAAQAVAAGRYGKAPAEGVRNTRAYKLWAQLFDAVQGEAEGSLLRALQARGFVKRRGR